MSNGQFFSVHLDVNKLFSESEMDDILNAARLDGIQTLREFIKISTVDYARRITDIDAHSSRTE